MKNYIINSTTLNIFLKQIAKKIKKFLKQLSNLLSTLTNIRIEIKLNVFNKLYYITRNLLTFRVISTRIFTSLILYAASIDNILDTLCF